MAQNNNKNGVEIGNKQWQLPSEHRWTGQYQDKSPNNRSGRMQQPRPHHRITSVPVPEPNSPMASPSRETPQRTRTGSKGATRGGSGMQAIFLGPNRTSGTGVFLPRVEGSDSQLLPKKPAYRPVLLPCRVVETLKLNVHQVGKQLKPQTDRPKITAKKNEDPIENKKVEVEYISPNIYLPKEWTY